MEKIAIGNAGLKTSRIGLGAWAIGGWMWGGTDEAQAIAAIRSAEERGGTLIDAAPGYGFGRSQEVVGKALAESGLRDKAQIANKVGLAWKDSEAYRDCRRAGIRQEIEDPKFRGGRLTHHLAAASEREALARKRFGMSVLALEVRWVLDQGPTIALWGARRPDQIDPVADIAGWQIDERTKADIDAILACCITDPVSPAFMAPPGKHLQRPA